MKQFLLKNKLHVIIGILLLIIVIILFTPKKPNLTAYKDKIELLERERKAIAGERDALKENLKQRDKTIEVLNHIDSLYKASIQTNNKAIYEIQKQRKTVDRIDHFSSDELQKFFSDLR